MNVQEVIKQLATKYPGKTIIENKNAEGTTTEIICELSNHKENPDQSIAIAVIDNSTIHFHKVITEHYKVMKGELTVLKYDSGNRDYKEHKLQEGEKIIVKPGEVHANVGEETWVEVTSNPAWFIEDYINLDTILKKYVSKR